MRQDRWIFLRFCQGHELFFDISPVEDVVLADRNAFGVADVEGAGGEQLHDHEILRGTGAELEPRGKLKWRGPLDRQFLKRQRAQRDIDAYATG